MCLSVHPPACLSVLPHIYVCLSSVGVPGSKPNGWQCTGGRLVLAGPPVYRALQPWVSAGRQHLLLPASAAPYPPDHLPAPGSQARLGPPPSLCYQRATTRKPLRSVLPDRLMRGGECKLSLTDTVCSTFDCYLCGCRYSFTPILLIRTVLSFQRLYTVSLFSASMSTVKRRWHGVRPRSVLRLHRSF